MFGSRTGRGGDKQQKTGGTPAGVKKTAAPKKAKETAAEKAERLKKLLAAAEAEAAVSPQSS